MKHLGTNKENNTIIVELNEEDLWALKACINAAEIRWGSKGKNFETLAEIAHNIWSEVYKLMLKIR